MQAKKIILNQTPISQPRARITKWGAFDPVRDAKAYAKLQIAEQIDEILEDPIELEVVFYMPIPKNTSKKKYKLMLLNEIKHQKQKDLDNMLKYLFDVFNEVVFKDDKQIWKITAQKLYSVTPKTEVTLRW